SRVCRLFFFFFQAEDGIRDFHVTGVQTCALPICFNVARSVGPALGGFIVAAFGAAVAFSINAFTYLGIIGVLVRWRPKSEPRLRSEERRVGKEGGSRWLFQY